MPSNLKSTLTPGISAETTVYSAPTSPVTTSTVIGVLVANNGDGPGTQLITIRLQRSTTYTNIVKQAILPAGDTFVPSGAEGKLVMMAGDNLKVSVNVGTVDVTTSYLEQTP
jgi:hypothetical protein